MSALLGIGGARRNACVAACVDGKILAVCEQERLTRARRVGLEPGWLPADAVDAVLSLALRRREDVSHYITAEQEIRLPAALPRIDIDHHGAHAAAAFRTSALQRAAVLVCDSHADREVSVWMADDSGLHDQQWPWRGRGLATLYSQCAALFGFAAHGQEHQLEALAHLGTGRQVDRLRGLFEYVDESVHVDPRWRARVYEMIEDECGRSPHPVETASAVQRRIGELLLDLVADIRATFDCSALCLGGGLFYNTYFATLIRRSNIFEQVFVPINPGNAGLAVGAALMVGDGRRRGAGRSALSPFLGPEYDSEAIKNALDGCKLSYAFVSEAEVVDQTVAALARGHLVGWFQGRMEWGPRALGHRSILADPRSPYVLENLNGFLRKREPWRAFGVSVCEDDAPSFFCGPPASAFMEYEYGLKDEGLRHVMPAGATAIRVQTIEPAEALFWSLHKRMAEATGTGVLVNTSFNGFHEPIACTPRDAIRVFYGTGLDMLVLGRFILRK